MTTSTGVVTVVRMTVTTRAGFVTVVLMTVTTRASVVTVVLMTVTTRAGVGTGEDDGDNKIDFDNETVILHRVIKVK